MSRPGDRLIISARKGLFIFERAASEWKMTHEAHVGIPVSYAICDPRNGTLWAGLDHGHWGTKLSRSLDGGTTWDEVTAPKYPEGEEVREGVPAALRYVYSISAGGADEPNRLYLGTDPGGLFVSDDGGETFDLVESLWNYPTRKTNWFGGGRDNPGIHSILVDPRDSKHVFLAISCAGVWESRDGAKTWELLTELWGESMPEDFSKPSADPHCLAFCASQPDMLWQQNHFGIYNSRDGARTWSLISKEENTAHFGFPIAADAMNPDVAWVVPASSDGRRVAPSGSMCVARTDDGGQSWNVFRKGLPQERCYDIVFRHGLDVSGDTLAIGSTTGNVFVSEDRGESWECLGNHLPPVYAVRFAPGM